ncbi:MAG: TetR/AcrR family transcriptional regulator [Clostridiales bacterium]|nr:TetR/AcrR family transcriptional regulator [Clostridiales bacterium]
MNGFERRKKEKEKIIIETALKLFQKNGIQNTPVSQIAKEAGVSQVTIFKYFDTKDNLVLNTVNYFVDESFNIFETVINKEVPFEEKIKEIIFMKKTYANNISQDFLIKFMEQHSMENSYIQNLYTTKGIRLYEKLFAQGRTEGKINNAISDQTLYLYLDMYSEYLKREDVYIQIAPLAEEFMNLFMYGVSGK